MFPQVKEGVKPRPSWREAAVTSWVRPGEQGRGLWRAVISLALLKPSRVAWPPVSCRLCVLEQKQRWLFEKLDAAREYEVNILQELH